MCTTIRFINWIHLFRILFIFISLLIFLFFIKFLLCITIPWVLSYLFNIDHLSLTVLAIGLILEVQTPWYHTSVSLRYHLLVPLDQTLPQAFRVIETHLRFHHHFFWWLNLRNILVVSFVVKQFELLLGFIFIFRVVVFGGVAN